MTDEQKQVEALIESLRRERDELRLKIHLGKAEVRDEWDRLERRWEEVKPKLEEAGKITADVSRNLGTAAGIAAEEIRAGYRKIRDALR